MIKFYSGLLKGTVSVISSVLTVPLRFKGLLDCCKGGGDEIISF